MNEIGGNIPTLMMLVGLLIVLSIFLRSFLERIGVPALIGFLFLGVLMGLAHKEWGFLSAAHHHILEAFAQVGVFTLLFRVGLESDLEGLLKQLRRASMVWTANLALTGLVGYTVALYLLDLGYVTAMIVAVAFTATSVGISVALWQEAGALKTGDGELLVDLAELDDISAVVLMALLFCVLPVL